MTRSALIKQAFRRTLTRISPTLNTKFSYFFKFHKPLNLRRPETLNEKLLWVKLREYKDSELVKQCADKYRARQYVEQAGCGELLNELYGVYRTPEEIDWDKLPERFVLKLNVASGYNHIVLDKQKEDKAALLEEMRGWLKEGPKYYMNFSEMQYAGTEPLILAEKYLGTPGGAVPADYKLLCFNGKCRMTMFCLDRGGPGPTKFFFLDRDWKLVFNFDHDGKVIRELSEAQKRALEKPALYEQAVAYAEKLSKPFTFVRVDFYLFEDKILFGEMTFTPFAGMQIWNLLTPDGSSEDFDHMCGKLLKLPTD